jgi:hypothetical protein
MELEFNFENKTPEQLKLDEMQKQLDQMDESMGKVRRRLFSELSQVKKLYEELQSENEILKSMIKEKKNEKTQWTYGQEGYLFYVSEHQKARC